MNLGSQTHLHNSEWKLVSSPFPQNPILDGIVNGCKGEERLCFCEAKESCIFIQYCPFMDGLCVILIVIVKSRRCLQIHIIACTTSLSICAVQYWYNYRYKIVVLNRQSNKKLLVFFSLPQISSNYQEASTTSIMNSFSFFSERKQMQNKWTPQQVLDE